MEHDVEKELFSFQIYNKVTLYSIKYDRGERASSPVSVHS